MADSTSKTRKASVDELRGRLGVSKAARLGEQHKSTWRDKLVDGAKTLIWVAPLTLLIWIYAEREQRISMPVSRVPIEVRSSAPDRIVQLISPEDGHMELDLYGPRASLEHARDRIADPRMERITIRVPGTLAPGSHILNPLDQFNAAPIFVDQAIAVQRSRPTGIEVFIMEKVRRQAPVRVRPEDKIVGDIVFDPPTVEVEGPAETLGRIPDEQLGVFADMSRFAGLKPGSYAHTVPIRFVDPQSHITYPQTVQAIVNVRESKVLILDTVPIKVMLPAVQFERDTYRITTTMVTLPNVTVTGPPELIQTLEDGKFIPSVIVELTPEDLQKPGVLTKRIGPADYRMPRDVSVTNPARDIEITLQPRGG